MKIRMTLLVGAGAVSGVVMAAAVPAGALSADPPPVAVGCTGTLYSVNGQLTEGPDALPLSDGGQLGLRGQLCVGDNHGNNGQASPVTGAVSVVEVNQRETLAPALAMRNPGIPVKGEVVGQTIRFDGRTSLDLTRATTAAALGTPAPARRIDVFIRAAGSQLTALPFNTALRSTPDYRGTFAGPRQQDAGTFVASPAYLAEK
jgi:hypothetical protein